MQIDQLRTEIDKIDNTLCELLEKRAEFSKQIGALKKEQGAKIFDKEREREIFNKITADSENKMLKELIFSDILSFSKMLQSSFDCENNSEDKPESFTIVTVKASGRLPRLFILLRDFKLLGFELSKIKAKESSAMRLSGNKGIYRFNLEFAGANISTSDMKRLEYIKKEVSSLKVVSL